MFEAGALLTLYAETPLHPGAPGVRGAVDQCVQRDAVKGLPVIWGSSLRGTLRDEACATQGVDVEALFGPEVDAGSAHAGAVSVGDANLLMFPVSEATRGWVWVTSPGALAGLARALSFCGLTGRDVSAPGKKCDHSLVVGDHQVACFTVDSTAREALVGLLPTVASYEPYRKRMLRALFSVSDADFLELTQSEVEVRTRIRLNERKTTTGGQGNMWAQEVLPAESVFFAALVVSRNAKPPAEVANDGQSAGTSVQVAGGSAALVGQLTKLGPVLQVGADESVGMGFVRATWITKSPKQAETATGGGDEHAE
jgi:CRISPR-associated protein Cmr4